MKDVIDSLKVLIYRMLSARGLIKYHENPCRTIISTDTPTVTRKLKVVYTVEEILDIELPAEPWTSSNRTLLVEELLRNIQKGISEDILDIYLCKDNKRICSLCSWYLEEFYSCAPCNDPCTNCDIMPRPKPSKCDTCF